MPYKNADPKWHARFIDLARHVATWSKDPKRQVGAVIVDDRRTVVGLGYNGFPRGCNDDPALYADSAKKLSMVVHAELNAILNANAVVRAATLYATAFSCDRCAVHIIQAGIARVIFPEPDNSAWSKWWESFHTAARLYSDAGVEAYILVKCDAPWSASYFIEPAIDYFSRFTPMSASAS